MTNEEIIKLAGECLESVPDIKDNIKRIDAELEKKNHNLYDSNDLNELKKVRAKYHRKLSKIIRSVSTLKEDEQRIICYRYFDKLKYSVISVNVGYSFRTIARRLEKSKLTIGRVMFGFEDEFFEEIYE